MLSKEDRAELAALYAEQDKLMSEHDQGMARCEAAGAAPVQKSDESVVLYREHHDNAPAPAPAAEADDPWKDWNAWLAGSIALHIEAEREVVAEAIAEVGAHIQRETRAERAAELVARDRRIGIVEGELKETASLLADTLRKLEASTAEIAELRNRLDLRDEREKAIAERSGRIAELQRENASVRREAERSQFDQALAEYRARIEQLETKLGMLLRFVGGDLPQGWGAS
jgi:hypothetical protein